MKFREDKGTGYLYCYNPSHPTANKAGKVIEHVFVMTEHIGRLLKPDECVHHINRDKKDNDLTNLRLMTVAEHTLLHHIEDNGYEKQYLNCIQCSKAFTCSTKSSQKCCSESCSRLSSRRFNIDRETLYHLVWTEPTSSVSKTLGISDVAVGKRCKLLNIPKPTRGYWAKIQAGITDILIPELPKED